VRLSHLVNSLPPYHFADAKKKIADRRSAGVDVITLSMGDPDLPAPQAVVDRLCAEMQIAENHRYPEYGGMRQFHEAIAAWFERRFGVRLVPEQQILPLLGSKEGLAYVAAAVLDAGDIALVSDPYYSVYITGCTNVGAQPYLLPLREEQHYLPDLESIPPSVVSKARLLWLNYPNNPTASCADRAFFERAVAFARQHNLVIIHDMAYGEVYFEDIRPISILQIPGADEVAVELHSFSKTYNMAGFRVGMIVGNAQLVKAVGRLKSNIDTGIFRPIQYAAIEALHLPETWLQERNAIYKRRRDILVAGCNELGMSAHRPLAGLYVWAHMPVWGGQARGVGSVQGTIPTASDFANWLFDKTGVFVTPGTAFGEMGEGFIRLSITAPEERLTTALQRMREVLQSS
jgi:LL-diaminopimelate aminotransferase